MHAVLDIGGGFTRGMEIPRLLNMVYVPSPGPTPKVVSFRLERYDEESDTAYYKVEAVTND